MMEIPKKEEKKNEKKNEENFFFFPIEILTSQTAEMFCLHSSSGVLPNAICISLFFAM